MSNEQNSNRYMTLVNKKDYYQKKSLMLERKLIFAEEKIRTLEEKIMDQPEVDQGVILEWKKKVDQLEQESKRLKNENDALLKQLKELSEKAKDPSKDKQIAQLKEQIVEIQASFEDKIKGYEELLKMMEVEINAKEQQAEIDRGKLKALEKQLAFEQKQAPSMILSQKTKPIHSLMSYFDYTFLLTSKEHVFIQANYHIENYSSHVFEDIIVCLTFKPALFAKIKGKILTVDQLATKAIENSSTVQWMFTEPDWQNKALKTGEVWIKPVQKVALGPEQKISVFDLQMPIEQHKEANLAIEGFVYSKSHELLSRSLNKVAIHF